MYTKAFIFKTDYRTLAEGVFALHVDYLQSLIDSQIFICVAEDNQRYALTNITVQPLRAGFLAVGFEPNTDVQAITTPIITPKSMWSEYDFDLCSVEHIQPFNVSTHNDKNNKQLIALPADLRASFLHYREGVYTLTDLVLKLHECGIFVSDIHQNLRASDAPIAVLSERPTHVFNLVKDNGEKTQDGFDLPDLARLLVLL